jgi:hypothetical protein
MSTVSSLQRSDFDERRLLWFALRFASFVRRRFRRKGHRRASDRRQRGDPLDPYGVNDLNAPVAITKGSASRDGRAACAAIAACADRRRLAT